MKIEYFSKVKSRDPGTDNIFPVPAKFVSKCYYALAAASSTCVYFSRSSTAEATFPIIV
jgi:hypothetical protein